MRKALGAWHTVCVHGTHIWYVHACVLHVCTWVNVTVAVVEVEELSTVTSVLSWLERAADSDATKAAEPASDSEALSELPGVSVISNVTR